MLVNGPTGPGGGGFRLPDSPPQINKAAAQFKKALLESKEKDVEDVPQLPAVDPLQISSTPDAKAAAQLAMDAVGADHSDSKVCPHCGGTLRKTNKELQCKDCPYHRS